MEIKPKSERLIKPGHEKLINQLQGRKFVASHRVGKYLFIELDDGLFLVVHFGMTGDFSYYRNAEDEPKNAKVIFLLENSFRLSYNSRRKLGWLDLTESIAAFQKEKKLGKDALDIEFEEFYQGLKEKQSPIKPRLMEQDLIAGIGNWVADEILYQSRVHPLSICQKIPKAIYQEIYNKMQFILNTALEHDSQAECFPEYFLIRDRKKGAKCHYNGKTLEILEVGGRTTFVCPGYQKAYK